MQPMKPDNSGAMSVEHLHNTAINFVEVVCSVIAMPVETLLRPWYGTRLLSAAGRIFLRRSRDPDTGVFRTDGWLQRHDSRSRILPASSACSA